MMKQSNLRNWGAVAALTIAITTVGLDMTVLNLALPILATALHASTSELQWFVDAYTLVLAATMLPCGLLGDRLGRKKVLIGALILFGLGSVLCAYAPSAGALIAARALLGVGAAALMPLSLSVLPVLFSETERPKAVAVLMIGTMLAFPIGPILGGWMLTRFWWGSVFLINVPVVVVALVAAVILLPESYGQDSPSLDIIGILTSSAGLVGITYGIIEGGMNGWGSVAAVTACAAGVLLLLTFVLWERHITHPLVDLTLFQSASFTWGTVLTTAVSFVMFGVLFTVPQYFQDIQGFDTLGAGIRLLPLIGGMLLSAPLANVLATRLGMNLGVGIGFTILAAGLVMGGSTSLQSGSGYGVAWLACVGAGLGFAMPTAMDAALGELSAESSGIGSALIQAVRQVGASIGVAVLGALFNAVYQSGLHVSALPGFTENAIKKNVALGITIAQKLHSVSLLTSIRSSFISGMDFMLWTCGVLAVVSVVLAMTFLPRRIANCKKVTAK